MVFLFSSLDFVSVVYVECVKKLLFGASVREDKTFSPGLQYWDLASRSVNVSLAPRATPLNIVECSPVQREKQFFENTFKAQIIPRNVLGVIDI